MNSGLDHLMTPIGDVHPSPRNPRTGHAVDAIARSLTDLGWHAPIVARKGTGEVTIGHGRLAAAQRLGLTHVPVLFLDDDDATAYARMVADNRLTEMSEWSVEGLQELVDGVDGLEDWKDDLDLDALLEGAEVELGQALGGPEQEEQEEQEQAKFSAKVSDLKAPFPWFGGKSRASALIWHRLGQVDNYVEPFAGSLAVLLGAPTIAKAETVNDFDGFVANFWRATSLDPEAVAQHADWPVNEADLHARHLWLVKQRQDMTEHLMGDPEYYDVKVAGWWVWGQCAWIGSGWCSGKGPWGDAGGRLQKRPHLGNLGQGVHKQLPHLGDLGQGVHKQLPHLGNLGQGVHKQRPLHEWFQTLHERLRRVRVCCGDWSRVLGPSVTTKLGLTAVVLDPPYDGAVRARDLYAEDDHSVSGAVRQWAIEHGEEMRIVLCGYESEHAMPDTWEAVEWSSSGAYTAGGLKGEANRHLERLWFSPLCERP